MTKVKIIHGAKGISDWETKINEFLEKLNKKECEVTSLTKCTLFEKEVVIVMYNTKEKGDDDTND